MADKRLIVKIYSEVLKAETGITRCTAWDSLRFIASQIIVICRRRAVEQ